MRNLKGLHQAIQEEIDHWRKELQAGRPFHDVERAIWESLDYYEEEFGLSQDEAEFVAEIVLTEISEEV